jgi:hypothetical protein
MLYENVIVDVTCKKLMEMGYVVEQRLKTTQRGFDIILSKNNNGQKIKLYIEAKGETTSQETNRLGKAFTRSQVRTHIGQALYKTNEALSLNEHCEIRVAVALPKNKDHLDLVRKIQIGLDKLGVALIWVNQDLSVEIQSQIAL